MSPIELALLAPSEIGKDVIEPYVFQGRLNDVNVKVIVGFYRELATERELDDERKMSRTTDNAGWTVVCNDRVVLHADKSAITGWGRQTVPKYHTQFISIAGVVEFTSNKSMQLPLNTTKRGINTSNEVYLAVLEYMMEGLKTFTDFTNKWKSREKETSVYFENSSPRAVENILPGDQEGKKWSNVRRFGSGGTAKKSLPKLPLPKEKNPNRRIVFVKPLSEISLLGLKLFDNEKAAPGDVGKRCFESQLKDIKDVVQEAEL